MTSGYFALVLHAHLPFVRHPEHSFFLEEDWLYEAITETYIPLIQAFDAMERDRVPFRITMSISPPLVTMLQDPLLQSRSWTYLMRVRELVGKELFRTQDHGHLNYLAHHYREQIDAVIATWQKYDGNLIKAFAGFAERGFLDILTSAATHGYLPLMQVHPEAVWAQIKIAVDHFTETFGTPPKGIWLPECGYYPGLDQMLAKAGLRYFIADTHGILLARPRPRHGPYAPIFCSGSGVAAFGRDSESALQVWSRDYGYPGDPVYREFYRDIGFELDVDYIGPYIQPNGHRKNTGIKYHRVTGKTDLKELYDPYWAREKAAQHASNFMFNRERQIAHLASYMQEPPIVVSPYDAELFGHWWYEGPWWLEYVQRKSIYDQQVFGVTHLADYLKNYPTHQICWLAQSSWGDRGFNEFWLNKTNEWIYTHLHTAAEQMISLANSCIDAEGLERRALNQAARELLLAQSSDWAFIMRTGTMVEYAVRRTQSHLRRFSKLHNDISSKKIERAWLERIEFLDNIFPNINYELYRSR